MAAWGLSRVPVIYGIIRGDPKYLVRPNKLINSSEPGQMSFVACTGLPASRRRLA